MVPAVLLDVILKGFNVINVCIIGAVVIARSAGKQESPSRTAVAVLGIEVGDRVKDALSAFNKHIKLNIMGLRQIHRSQVFLITAGVIISAESPAAGDQTVILVERAYRFTHNVVHFGPRHFCSANVCDHKDIAADNAADIGTDSPCPGVFKGHNPRANGRFVIRTEGIAVVPCHDMIPAVVFDKSRNIVYTDCICRAVPRIGRQTERHTVIDSGVLGINRADRIEKSCLGFYI